MTWTSYNTDAAAITSCTEEQNFAQHKNDATYYVSK